MSALVLVGLVVLSALAGTVSAHETAWIRWTNTSVVTFAAHDDGPPTVLETWMATGGFVTLKECLASSPKAESGKALWTTYYKTGFETAYSRCLPASIDPRSKP